MDLYYREYGRRVDDRPPLILLHGLFGSSANWHSIARRLEDRLLVIVPDLRNHGRSPWAEAMGYPQMASDVLGLMDRLDFDQVMLVGHSMGGKAAMWLALERSRRVERLMVVDMAPVRYEHSFDDLLDALQRVDPGSLGSRAEAETMLLSHLHNRALAQYLLQNLALQDGRYYWRVNLDVLARDIEAILDFPPAGERRFAGRTWFLYGGQSDYVTPAHNAPITDLFPHARLRMLAGAGHWVYAEKPEEFLASLTSFIQAR